MSNDPTVAPEFRSIYEEGICVRDAIDVHLAAWPVDNNRIVDEEDVSDEIRARIEDLRDWLHRWFNGITINVLPQTSYDRAHLTKLLRRVSAAIGSKEYHEEYHPFYIPMPNASTRQPAPQFDVEVLTNPDAARHDAQYGMNDALRIVRTAQPSSAGRLPGAVASPASYVPNTAFILMWMDRSKPELVDIHEAVKSTFAEFGIRAFRADEIQHQDRITDLILDQIESSEFLFADLSGERPNVYYEVGYAHAVGKHPVLFRKAGTPLHFDLSVHNVPEYANVTELKQSLRERLAAMTGRKSKPAQSGG